MGCGGVMAKAGVTMSTITFTAVVIFSMCGGARVYSSVSSGVMMVWWYGGVMVGWLVG